MTAIAGVEYDGGVVIGGDNAATWDDFGRISLATDKVWTSGEWIFGECGGVRSGQLIRYNFDIPNIPDYYEEDEIERFLCTTFVDSLRAVLVDSGVVQSKHAIETLDMSSTYLVGIRGQLWLLDEDFGMVRSSGGYWAIGCGKDLALGALHASEDISPEDRVLAALEAAAAHNSAVMGPFTIIDQPYEVE